MSWPTGVKRGHWSGMITQHHGETVFRSVICQLCDTPLGTCQGETHLAELKGSHRQHCFKHDSCGFENCVWCESQKWCAPAVTFEAV